MSVRRVARALTLLLTLGGPVSHAEGQTPTVARHRLPLEVLPDTLAICRLPPDAPLPGWATVPAPFLTVSRTSEELSVTLVQRAVPTGVRCERDYRAIRVRGTLPPRSRRHPGIHRGTAGRCRPEHLRDLHLRHRLRAGKGSRPSRGGGGVTNRGSHGGPLTERAPSRRLTPVLPKRISRFPPTATDDHSPLYHPRRRFGGPA